MDRKWWRRLEILWLVAFTAALVFAWQANNNRISDIQHARKASCERTYEGIREVFKPFFPKHPKGKQLRDEQKFNRTINGLKAHCTIQTRTTPTK